MNIPVKFINKNIEALLSKLECNDHLTTYITNAAKRCVEESVSYQLGSYLSFLWSDITAKAVTNDKVSSEAVDLVAIALELGALKTSAMGEKVIAALHQASIQVEIDHVVPLYYSPVNEKLMAEVHYKPVDISATVKVIATATSELLNIDVSVDHTDKFIVCPTPIPLTLREFYSFSDIGSQFDWESEEAHESVNIIAVCNDDIIKPVTPTLAEAVEITAKMEEESELTLIFAGINDTFESPIMLHTFNAGELIVNNQNELNFCNVE